MESIVTLDSPDAGSVILSGITATPYTGTGSPWGSNDTSPYRLSMNEVTGGVWTPQAPPLAPVDSGGPPFRAGSDLALWGYDNVTETVGVQMYAAAGSGNSAYTNAVSLLNRLRRILSVSAGTPATLTVQFHEPSDIVIYELTSATVQEDPSFVAEEANNATLMIRALVTWTRRPFGTGQEETAINAVTVGNNGTGSPDNLESLGTGGKGDLIYEGAPLNVAVSLPSTYEEVLIATAAGRSYAANTSSITTSSTTGLIPAATLSGIGSFSNFASRRVKARILIRVSNVTSNLQVRARVTAASGPTPEYMLGPWVTILGGTANTVLVDLGSFDPIYAYRAPAPLSTATFTVFIDSRSTNGGSATGTMVNAEVVYYYTYGTAYAPAASGLVIRSYLSASGIGWAGNPIPVQAYGTLTSGTAYQGHVPFRGRAPVYISGASLWVAARSGSDWQTSTASTMTLTATHGPLYHTLRGVL